MRRILALTTAVCLLGATACDSSSGSSEAAPETVEDLAEEGLVGLALIHRGFEGADPETEQVLVFHDADTGAPLQRIELPDGAVDPMAPEVPVHGRFSDDWQYFAFTTKESNAVHLAVLTEPEDAEDEEIEGFSYQPVETIAAGQGETLSEPLIHGERLWYVAGNGEGQPPQVMSVPLEAPQGTPNQEGSLALGEGQRPSDWAITPDGSLHIRNSVPTQQVAGGEGDLVVRATNGTVVNATLTTGGRQWQTFDDATVWGGDHALLRTDGGGDGAPQGVLLLTLEDQGYSTTPLAEDEDAPVVQFAPSAERDAVLLQTEAAWFRVDMADGEVAEAEELFPRFHDASMDGWPLLVRWSQEPPADPSAEPSQSPTS
ncbi:hypothetical protein [Nocardiopsis sp. MG754419]|uniref:hypothetical protein n=1 Tax=Nocardiopsis sp. MG754419 TaxID=2259865 RepID=UPI001BA8AE74|nr:hypothetical protein [Nocardiopsis sp. MG754419]MBR8743575.1 hypothetical protein [Nocardiopsis sp. MG754419]